MVFNQVKVGVDVLSQRLGLYEAICHSAAEWNGSHECVVRFSDVQVLLVEGARQGVIEVGFQTDRLTECESRLRSAGLPFDPQGEQIRVAAVHASGVDVVFTDVAMSSVVCGADLDHVALRVHDLEGSTRLWSHLLGVAGEIVGIHPVSGGTFTASRLMVGNRMIELVSPVRGRQSNISERLDSHGEGAAVLALPSRDIESTRRSVQALGIELIWQDPHWMVHPKDSGGVLIQLTPRVAH